MLNNVLSTIRRPDNNYQYNDSPEYKIDQQKLAFFVGFIALMLPLTLILYRLSGGISLDSISHYYYSKSFGVLFVVSLAFIGTFLIAYRGENFWINCFATIAGFAAFGIAIFPTSGPGILDQVVSVRVYLNMAIDESGSNFNIANEEIKNTFKFTPYSQYLHYISAATLFIFLAFYSFVVFPSILNITYSRDGIITKNKVLRNKIYYASGWLILISIAALGSQKLWGIAWNKYDLTFVFEAIALVAFGLAWMVKGRFYGYALVDEHE